MESVRKLIIFPVKHTYTDLGSVAQGSHSGISDSAARQQWAGIKSEIDQLKLDYSRVKIYQDGLADTSRDIVDKIVGETKGVNHEFLRWLKSQGALIIGTEDPGLLVQDKQLSKRINDDEGKTNQVEYTKEGALLLDLRDEYMAKRIEETLLDGETGILFIGKNHDVGSFLEGKMEVVTIEISHSLQLEAEVNSGTERKFV